MHRRPKCAETHVLVAGFHAGTRHPGLVRPIAGPADDRGNRRLVPRLGRKAPTCAPSRCNKSPITRPCRDDSHLPPVRRTRAAQPGRSWRDAAGQLLRDRGTGRARRRPSLSAASPGLRPLPAGAGRRNRSAGSDLRCRLRVFLVVFLRLGGACAALRRGDGGALRPRTRSSLVAEVASNDGYLLQHFQRDGHSGAGHRAGWRRRGGRAPHRRADRANVLRCGHRGRAGVALWPCRPDRRQQRAGARAGPARLRRRLHRHAAS